MLPSVMEVLERDYQLHRLYQAEDVEKFLAPVAKRIRGVAAYGHSGIDNRVVDLLPNLEIIACFGVGVDAVDLEHAQSRGIIVSNTPDVLNDDVANLAVALLLATSRGIVAGDRYVREGRWLKGGMKLMHSVRGKRVGILGLGRIGKDIATKLAVFGCEIMYHGRHEQPDQPYSYYADLVAMARDCDYMIVVCPGGDATRGIVNRAVIEALGPEGTLINVARGSVVDEPELVSALADGRLGGAGLDVFADEPRVPEALFALDNVVLQPHVGSATGETRWAMGDLMVRNLAAHMAGKPVLTRVV